VPLSQNAWSAEAIQRKLRALAAVLLDPAATENERANAQALKLRLQKRLRQAATAPKGGWTGMQIGRAHV